MVINDKRWNTVTNFILSNMLITPQYQVALQNANVDSNKKIVNVEDHIRQYIKKVEQIQERKMSDMEIAKAAENIRSQFSHQKMGIYDLYNEYLSLEYFNTTRTAVEKAYNAKVSENNELAQILKETENRPILYISNNSTLGMGPDGRGANLIGKTLMQIRHNILVSSRIEQKEHEENSLKTKIFEIYQAYLILLHELKNDDLKEYIDLSPQQIIELYTTKNSLSDLGIKDSQSDLILQMYNRGQLPMINQEIIKPKSLAYFIRKKGLDNIRENIKNKRNETILTEYVKYNIRKKFPKMSNEDVTLATHQLFSSAPTLQAYHDLRNDIITLYNKGLFNDELNESISDALSGINSPASVSRSTSRSSTSRSKSEDTSSSDDEDEDFRDPIKQLLRDDEKKRKKYLIQKIQDYTGRFKPKYKKYSIEKLEKKLRKHEKPRGKGVWYVKYEDKVLGEISGENPTKEQIATLVSMYNQKYYTKISPKDVKVKRNKDEKEFIFNDEKKPEEVIAEREKLIDPMFRLNEYVKHFGKPIEIHAKKDDNPEVYQPFSPIFETEFTVDNLPYNCVSSYITTMLLSQTGINAKYLRGKSVNEARKMLIDDGVFYDPNKAIEIYNKSLLETHKTLLKHLAYVGISKKFEDVSLQDVLLLSGHNTLVWDDKSDVYLGVGPDRKGENVVGKILIEIREKVEKSHPPFPTVDVSNFDAFVKKDPFMNTWFEMRLMDMCGTVYKLQQYLYKSTKEEQELDARFVRRVLDIIYQPCSGLISMTKKINIPVSDYFVKIVETCQGIPQKTSKEDQDAKIQVLYDQVEQLEMDFWNFMKRDIDVIDRNKENNFDIIDFTEKQNRDRKRYMETNPTEDELNLFEKNQKKALEDFIKKNEERNKNVDTAQQDREEWEEFLKKINKPKLDAKEITDKYNRFVKKQKGIDTEFDLKFIEKQKKERQDFWKKLNQPELDAKERKRLIYEFTQKKEQEIAELKGDKKDKKELAKHNQDLTELRHEISLLKKTYKDEAIHIEHTMREIAQVYWDRLMAMLAFLIQYTKNSNEQDIRQSIVTIEMLNSRKLECSNIPVNLDNPQDNCIVSAISNLLVGVQKFKYQYGENIPIDTADIDLCVSIILNRKVEVVSDVQIQPEMEDKAFEDDMADENNEEEADIEDIENAIPDDSPISFSDLKDEDMFGFGKFGMGKKGVELKSVDYIQSLKTILKEIYQNKKIDLDKMAKHFSVCIGVVKDSKLTNRIKQNRINFFATIRG